MTIGGSLIGWARAGLVSLTVALGIVTAAPPASAEVRASSLIGDHMVVQQQRPVRLSGSAAPGEAIRAALGSSHAATTADAGGRWQLALPPLAAGGPFTLIIEGSNRLSFRDIWAGEVWVAAGQSNMQLPLTRSHGGAQVAAAGCSGLHLFMVAQVTSAEPKAEVEGKWRACDAAAAAEFSAVAFHFGRELHRALGIPVGLVQAAWGGTPAEAWTPREALLADPALRPTVDAYDLSTRDPARRAQLARQLADWEAKSFHVDTGNRGEALGFARPRGGRAAGAGWSKMELPQPWENAGLAMDGAVWFRREVTVPADWAGTDLTISLGALDDFDVTYWNGERIGATGAETPEYWAARRRYPVPARLVKAGRNLIAVRVFDHFGSGGFAGTPSQLTVAPRAATAAAGPRELSLAGTWDYKIERRLPPAVVDFESRPRSGGADDPESPSVLWNGMVAPLAGLPAAGVIWYQGESNVVRAALYRTLFPAMIRAWRARWSNAALPFLFVQLPNYQEPVAGPSGAAHRDADAPAAPPALAEGRWAELREAQALALREPRTAMAVTLDIGEPNDIHPREKQEVGRRLALQALRMVYGRDALAFGPTFAGAAREKGALRIRFAAVAGGLTTSDGDPPRGFVVAGADRVWRRAEARIDGDSVIVSSPEVVDPQAVRYGWGNDPVNTLRNQADLPAAPFRTDDWPAPGAAVTAAAAPAR
jgi:sialate O-acetylesterase